jgi:transcriptional repressor NrdR
MRCLVCGSHDTRVIDSRTARQARAIRRRRECEDCSERFTTYEVIESTRPNVLKADGKTEAFNPDKVLKSLRLACSKRAIELSVLTDFVQSLDAQVSTGSRRTIPTSEVGEHILVFLRSLDPVAYVRYASVYRSFSDVDEFIDELRRIRAEDGLGDE